MAPLNDSFYFQAIGHGLPYLGVKIDFHPPTTDDMHAGLSAYGPKGLEVLCQIQFRKNKGPFDGYLEGSLVRPFNPFCLEFLLGGQIIGQDLGLLFSLQLRKMQNQIVHPVGHIHPCIVLGPRAGFGRPGPGPCPKCSGRCHIHENTLQGPEIDGEVLERPLLGKIVGQ